jgi:hypothetical protein
MMRLVAIIARVSARITTTLADTMAGERARPLCTFAWFGRVHR